ncbi:MAG: DUF2480 family protein [Bacteroidota bacterium]
MDQPIENKVARSGLVTIDLEAWYPAGERVLFDIKDLLWQEIALKEKDFRTFVKAHDWAQYQGKLVALHCSVDAIVPTWAFMLLATALAPYAQDVVFGNLEQLERSLYQRIIDGIDGADYQDQRVVIKGCSDREVPADAYVALTRKLQPFARSIMYGEPCSTVPLYKRPRNT